MMERANSADAPEGLTGAHRGLGPPVAGGLAQPAPTQVKEPERQPGERAQSYALFIDYLRLGPHRTLRQLSGKVVKGLAALEKLCSRHQWRARAAAFDEQVQREEEAALNLLRLEARKQRQLFELERQRMAQEMARAATRRVLEMLNSDVRLVLPEPLDPQAYRFANTAPLTRVAALMREANRLALSAVADAFRAAEARLAVKVKDRQDNVHAISGQFSVGDVMFDGSEPPPLPRAQPTEMEPAQLVEPEAHQSEADQFMPWADLAGYPAHM